MLLYQTLVFTTHGKIQKGHTETSLPTWNEEFELPYGLYSASDIQDYFEYILRKQNMEKRLISFNKNM